MIPKIIHYCWFGESQLPPLAQKCIESWRRYFPDYEIKEWNESNFDIDVCNYTKEAYRRKRWAFVSDYARFWILYHHGGIYFDTDVEVISSFDEIISRGAFMGVEADGGIAPGLGLGAPAGLPLFKDIISYYDSIHFEESNGYVNDITVVDHMKKIIPEKYWNDPKDIQFISDIYIYPATYLCPLNYFSGQLNITEKTVSIHHYSASWHTKIDEIIYKIEKCDRRLHPVEYKIRRICSLPFRIGNKMKKSGFMNTLSFAVMKSKKQISKRS